MRRQTLQIISYPSGKGEARQISATYKACVEGVTLVKRIRTGIMANRKLNYLKKRKIRRMTSKKNQWLMDQSKRGNEVKNAFKGCRGGFGLGVWLGPEAGSPKIYPRSIFTFRK